MELEVGNVFACAFTYEVTMKNHKHANVVSRSANVIVNT